MPRVREMRSFLALHRNIALGKGAVKALFRSNCVGAVFSFARGVTAGALPHLRQRIVCCLHRYFSRREKRSCSFAPRACLRRSLFCSLHYAHLPTHIQCERRCFKKHPLVGGCPGSSVLSLRRRLVALRECGDILPFAFERDGAQFGRASDVEFTSVGSVRK